jgi:hypothetical protein
MPFSRKLAYGWILDTLHYRHPCIEIPPERFSKLLAMADNAMLAALD